MSEMRIELSPKFCFVPRFFANFRIKWAISLVLAYHLELLFVMFFGSQIMDFYENNPDKEAVHISIIIITFFAFPFLFFLLLDWICVLWDKKNFAVTSYKVYDDRIEFDEGFFKHKHTSVLFKDIKEINFGQNFFQKKYDIGTIRFVKPANYYGYGRVRTRKFQDIENYKNVYEIIKKIYNNVKVEVWDE
ncbi:MAG: PH domain-containing protein [Alphaproteobacteria bacterium]|nr:PH domain-containing protein [Alphaproteobacteria bacterium]